MLSAQGERVITFFAADYEAVVGFEPKLAAAAESIQARLKAPHWGFGRAQYFFRQPVERWIVVLDFRRFFVQTLGLEGFQRNLDVFAAAAKTAFETLGISKLNRIGVQSQAYLQLGMSHAEMVDLAFGSYLVPAQELQEICGKPEDLWLQLHGERENMKLQLIVAPMTADQASQQIMQTQNLELFLEPKLLDTGVKDFRDRVAVPCLHVAVDLSRKDPAASDVLLFPRQALGAADRITENAVQKLKSLRGKKGR